MPVKSKRVRSGFLKSRNVSKKIDTKKRKTNQKSNLKTSLKPNKKVKQVKQVKKSNNVYRLSQVKWNDNLNSVNKTKTQKEKIQTNKQKRIEAVKRRKRKRRNITTTRFVIFIVFASILVYLGGYAYSFVTKEAVAFDTIQYGSIDAPKTVEGMIIRDEKLYVSPVAGVVSYNIADHEKVKKGTIVCSIRDEEVVSKMETELKDINESIINLQESREDMSWFAEDVKRVNNQVKDIVDENSYKFAKMQINEIYEFKSNLQKKIDLRNQMLLSENRGSLQELVQKKEIQESELSKNITNISAQEGGIVSYYIDGLEQTFTPENIETLTEGQVKTKPKEISEMKNEVIANENVFKMINSNIWYIASYIPNDYIKDWEENDIQTIYVTIGNEESVPLNCTVTKLNPGEKDTYVVLKLTKGLIDYIEQRNISFEISKPKVGFKISNSAIVEKTLIKIPSKYVEEGIVKKVVNESIKDIAIVNSGDNAEEGVIYTPVKFGILNVGDIVVNPKDEKDTFTISDVVNTKGIYIINTGVAEFNKINAENMVQNSTHTILDPALNTNINIYDRIVTDTNNVEEQQKLYK